MQNFININRGENSKNLFLGRNSIHFSQEEDLFLMANLFQEDTGLPMIIWVSERGHTQHGPRIKVSKSHSAKVDIYNTVSVSITNKPEIVAGEGLSNRDLKLITDYILLNKETLLAYWNNEISTLTLARKLIRLSQ